jgi:hypothetical protein
LSGKYWNSSAKGDCPNNDDSEGITLESLGEFCITAFCIIDANYLLSLNICFKN